jgi:site-specific DNA-cytosine methylase
MTLTHGELFAGISGFGLGMQRAGIPTLWHVEIDRACQEVERRHFQDTPIFDDVCAVGAHNLEYVDVISFGSPCQDLSVAGKRKGLGGERSISNLAASGSRPSTISRCSPFDPNRVREIAGLPGWLDAHGQEKR